MNIFLEKNHICTTHNTCGYQHWREKAALFIMVRSIATGLSGRYVFVVYMKGVQNRLQSEPNITFQCRCYWFWFNFGKNIWILKNFPISRARLVPKLLQRNIYFPQSRLLKFCFATRTVRPEGHSANSQSHSGTPAWRFVLLSNCSEAGTQQSRIKTVAWELEFGKAEIEKQISLNVDEIDKVE